MFFWLADPLYKRYQIDIHLICVYKCSYFKFYFSVLSTSFSNFSHDTQFTIAHFKYLGFEDGPPFFKQNFTCFVLLIFFYFLNSTGLSPSMVYFFQNLSSFIIKIAAYSSFAHHYYQNLFWFFFHSLLRCFTSRSFFLFDFSYWEWFRKIIFFLNPFRIYNALFVWNSYLSILKTFFSSFLFYFLFVENNLKKITRLLTFHIQN